MHYRQRLLSSFIFRGGEHRSHRHRAKLIFMPSDSNQKSPIRVLPFSTQECPAAPSSGPPLFTWREYYAFRNALLRVLRAYGTVGPMGEMPLLADWESSEAAWPSETSAPDFFVVDDMWNDRSRWNRVEASPWLVNTALLWDVVLMVQNFPDWCVYLALQEGGLTVFGNRILYEGTLFAGTQSIEDLGTRCQSLKPG
jgi:hypothetical protein